MGAGDYYDILGIPRSADDKEIKKAYLLFNKNNYKDLKSDKNKLLY